MDQLAGFFVHSWRLSRTVGFPIAHRLTHERIYRFREALASLVDRNVEVANLGSRRRVRVPVLANTAEPQTTNLVCSQSTEQPNQSQSAHHAERVVVVRTFI